MTLLLQYFWSKQLQVQVDAQKNLSLDKFEFKNYITDNETEALFWLLDNDTNAKYVIWI